MSRTAFVIRDGLHLRSRHALRTARVRLRGPADRHRDAHHGHEQRADVLGDFGKALPGTTWRWCRRRDRIDLPAVLVHEVADGKAIAERQYWGLLEFLVQIGVIGE